MSDDVPADDDVPEEPDNDDAEAEKPKSYVVRYHNPAYVRIVVPAEP